MTDLAERIGLARVVTAYEQLTDFDAAGAVVVGDAIGRPYELLEEALAAVEHTRLHFAGEATSVESAATVHGAWLSGQRAAAEVLDAS